MRSFHGRKGERFAREETWGRRLPEGFRRTEKKAMSGQGSKLEMPGILKECSDQVWNPVACSLALALALEDVGNSSLLLPMYRMWILKYYRYYVLHFIHWLSFMSVGLSSYKGQCSVDSYRAWWLTEDILALKKKPHKRKKNRYTISSDCSRHHDIPWNFIFFFHVFPSPARTKTNA